MYNDRPTVFFNYTLTKDGRSVSGSYDFAEFNSTGGAPPTSPAPMPSYQINGQAFNPTGFLLNDAEIMLGGPGGGSTTTLWNIAGSFGLWTLPNGTSTYKDVPSAYDFGTDTGETSEGIAEYSSGGPNPVAMIDSGPSILYPLWGIAGSVPMGAVQQTLHITPSNAFVFVSRDRPFNESIAAWAPVPTSGTATYWLPPGTYSYEVLLSEHSPSSFALTGNVLSQTVTLPLNTALGVYTPLYAFGNGQLAAISQAGVGTVKDPYVLYNNQVGPISSLFDEFNDYLFPVFPGILLVNTTDFVSVWDAPSFFFTYGTFPEQATVVAEGLPLSNYLEYNFYGVTHVSITDTPLITGWIFADDVGFTEASVVFWNSSYNLIAGNSFQVMSQALILFGGSHNTIWGNLFNPISAGAPNPAAIGLAGSQFAITMWESQDMTYNNAFLTPVTAYTPTVNIYNGAPALYMDHWNVPRQAGKRRPLGERLAPDGKHHRDLVPGRELLVELRDPDGSLWRAPVQRGWGHLVAGRLRAADPLLALRGHVHGIRIAFGDRMVRDAERDHGVLQHQDDPLLESERHLRLHGRPDRGHGRAPELGRGHRERHPGRRVDRVDHLDRYGSPSPQRARPRGPSDPPGDRAGSAPTYSFPLLFGPGPSDGRDRSAGQGTPLEGPGRQWARICRYTHSPPRGYPGPT